APLERRQADGKGKGKGKELSGPAGGCFHCGGAHFASDCTAKGKGGSSKGSKGKGKDSDADQRCFECGKKDHIARDCPSRQGEGRGGGKGQDGVRPSQREYEHVHKITFEDREVLDPKFPLGARIIGKGGRNTQHIKEVTGAYVWLRGKGTGSRESFSSKVGEKWEGEADEPLHVIVCSDDLEGFQEAIDITTDLIETVYEQYAEWLETGGEREDSGPRGDISCHVCKGDHFARDCPERGDKGKGKGKGKSKSKGKGKGKGRDDHDEPPAKRARK
ncbi:unnamed protein product, partial [Polarella glacialis]